MRALNTEVSRHKPTHSESYRSSKIIDPFDGNSTPTTKRTARPSSFTAMPSSSNINMTQIIIKSPPVHEHPRPRKPVNLFQITMVLILKNISYMTFYITTTVMDLLVEFKFLSHANINVENLFFISNLLSYLDCVTPIFLLILSGRRFRNESLRFVSGLFKATSEGPG